MIAAQRGQQRAGLLCDRHGDLHQSGAYCGHVCGGPGEAGSGPGTFPNLLFFVYFYFRSSV